MCCVLAPGALGTVLECSLKLHQLTREEQGYPVGGRFTLVSGASVIVGCLCECCMCAVIVKLDQLAERRSMGGEGDQVVGMPGGQKGLADSRGKNKCACVCEPGECSLCVCISDLLQPKHW